MKGAFHEWEANATSLHADSYLYKCTTTASLVYLSFPDI